VLCELLLREALADMGLDAEPVFAFGESGKPYLTAPEGIAFSFAHSGETAVCAVTRETAIGGDAERVRPVTPRVALRCFTEREREALAGGGAGVFFRLWTQKESFLKAVGGGVSMRAFEVEAEGGAVRQDFAPGNYETHVHSLGEDCPLAVCLRAAT
jgi:4'-phosphopantetheinyl transferase